MRILDQEPQSRFEVHRRQAGYLQRRDIRSRDTVRLQRCGPCFARLQHVALMNRGRRIRAADVDVDLALGTMAAAGRHELHATLAETIRRAQLQHAELLIGLAELHLHAARAHHLEERVRLDRQRDVPDAGARDEQRHRYSDFLARADHARHRRQQHQRLAHEHGFLRRPVGRRFAGHHHHAHRSHVGRQLDHVLRGRARLQLERTEEADDRRKARFRRLGTLAIRGIRTAEREQPLELRAVRTGHVIVKVPGQHAERFALVELAVQVRRPEVREPEQALIDHGHGVGHRAAARLGNFDLHFGFRLPLVCRLQHGREPRVGIGDLQRNHAIQAQRAIVALVLVRLDQRDGDVDVRRHLRRDRQREARVLRTWLDPAALEDAAAVLHRQQRATLRRLRQLDRRGVTHLVFGLVRRDGQHARGDTRLLALLARPRRPVDVERAPGAVATLDVTHPDEVAAPFRILDVERPLALAAGRRDHFAADRGIALALHVLRERIAVLVPPPLPLHFIERHLHLGDRDGLAVRRQRGDLHDVVLVGHQHVARHVALREAQTDIALERRIRRAVAVDAECAALLEHARRERRRETARRRGVELQGLREFRIAGAVELALENGLRLRTELTRRIIEDEIRVAGEARGRRSQAQFHVRAQPGGRAAGQPLRRDRTLDRAAGGEAVRAEIERDLEAVRHDGFDLHALAERRAAEQHLRGPVAGGCGLAGLQFEAIEAADRRGVRHGLHELAARIVELHRRRVIGGQGCTLVLQHERQMQRVARAPDAALTVDVALESLGDGLAADVEMTDRQCGAGAELEESALIVRFGDQQERRAGRRDRRHAVGIGSAEPDFLVLEVAHRELRAGHRRGGAQVRGGDQQLAVLIALREQADVRREQIALRRDVLTPAVIRARTGIAAAAPVTAALSVILIGKVPVGGLILIAILLALQHGLGFRGVARRSVVTAIQRIARRDLQFELEHAARKLLRQLRDIERVPLPAPGVRARERDRLAPQEAADPTDLVVAVQRVDLQELRDVVVVDAGRHDTYRTNADGLERHRQNFAVRKDHALADEAHLRLRARERQGARHLLAERLTARVANAGLERHRHFTLQIAFRVDRHEVVVDLRRELDLGREAHESAQILPFAERIGKADQDLATSGGVDGLGFGDQERTARRHIDRLFARRARADGLAVPLHGDGLGLRLTFEPQRGEAMGESVAVVGPLEGHGLAEIGGRHQRFDLRGLFDIGRVQRAAQDHAPIVRRIGFQPLQRDVELRRLHAEAEFIGRQILRHALQALGPELDGVLLARLQLGSRREHQFAAAGECRLAGHRGLDAEDGRGVCLDGIGRCVDDIAREQDVDRAATRYDTGRVAGDDRAPGLLGGRVRPIGGGPASAACQ